MRIYVAGPYCPQDCTLHDAARVAQQNTNRAIDAGIELLEKGHHPYIPHLSHYIHQRMHYDYDKKWYDFDLVWLRLCEAIVMLPGWEESTGARQELEEAKKLGLKIYHSLDEVPKA